jgi:hypothetical protein
MNFIAEQLEAKARGSSSKVGFSESSVEVSDNPVFRELAISTIADHFR